MPGSIVLLGVISAALRFTDVSSESGIVLVNVCGEPVHKVAIPESLGAGAAALDYDGDGRLDLFIANGDVLPGTNPRTEPRPALYRNEGGMRFRDVTAETGLLFRAWSHGATAVDFDADGDPDLYVTIYFGPNRFFRNLGNGRFEDAADWGGRDEGPSTAAAFFDADGDSDLDLYVANYVVYDPEAPPNAGRLCDWKGQPVFCGPWGTIPAPDAFYENRDGRLVTASERFGFATPKPAYGLGAVTGDFDNDGDTDLYVANDSVPNFLFENLGEGRFAERALEYGADRRGDGEPQAGMGVDFGDVDNDGRFEYFVTNFASDTDTLYQNLEAPGGGTVFADVTNAVGLGEPSYAMLSWGTRIADLDHDGWQDIVVASGHIYPQADAPGLGTSYAQPNLLYRNLGPGSGGRIRFVEEGARAGEGFGKIASSRGLVTADFDEDGDLDLLFVEMDGPPTLLRNDTSERGSFVGFALQGSGGNRDAIGARVLVEDSEGVLRSRERTSGGSYLSTSDPRLLFGLGAAGGPLRAVTVRWPSGRVDVHRDLAVDRYWQLEEAAPPAVSGVR